MTIKEYRKTATIKAEQFDGSDEMIKKYGLIDYETFDLGMNYDVTNKLPDIDGKTQAYIPTLEGKMRLLEGDYIATGVDGEHWAIKSDVFEKTYEEVD